MKKLNCSIAMEPLQPIQLSEVLDILHRIPTTLMAILLSAFKIMIVWQQRAEMRNRLYQLDARSLEDIGLSREEAIAEAGKPFWVK